MRHWFLPETPDVLAVLREQAEQTVDGLRAFVEWSSGDASRERVVRDAEHAADAIRRRLLGQLRAAFSTPMGHRRIDSSTRASGKRAGP